MDTLTHIVLGGCIGEAILGKKLGKKALLIGAIAQILPDVDVVAALWLEPATNLLAHRGISHSIFFVVLATAILSLVARYSDRLRRVSTFQWLIFFFIQTGSHVFIDLFNNYGVGLWEPFHNKRLSFHALYVADPLFTLGPLTGFFVLLILRAHARHRSLWWKIGIVSSMIYLCISVINKWKITSDVNEALQNQQISYQSYLATPSPFNNLLWFIVVKADSGCYVGYRSVFDNRTSMDLRYSPSQDTLLQEALNQNEVAILQRFSQGYYTAERWGDTLVFNDLRFGQVIGWQNPRERFAFHYYLLPAEASNKLVVQRGRFAKWNDQTLPALFKRIRCE
ncbi:MAG: metal-dependent hydrolase [Flavisolibacter sp.]